jgi:hypothetical protein
MASAQRRLQVSTDERIESTKPTKPAKPARRGRKPDSGPTLTPLAQAAELTGLTERTLRRRSKEGTFAEILRVGSTEFVRTTALETWLLAMTGKREGKQK